MLSKMNKNPNEHVYNHNFRDWENTSLSFKQGQINPRSGLEKKMKIRNILNIEINYFIFNRTRVKADQQSNI